MMQLSDMVFISPSQEQLQHFIYSAPMGPPENHDPFWIPGQVLQWFVGYHADKRTIQGRLQGKTKNLI